METARVHRRGHWRAHRRACSTPTTSSSAGSRASHERRSGSGVVAGPARSDSPLLHTGGGRTEIELQLLFDVDLRAPADAPRGRRQRPRRRRPARRGRAPGPAEPRRRDVRDHTTPAVGPRREQRRRRPHRTRGSGSCSGSGSTCSLSSRPLAERFEKFDATGTPGRSWMTMRLVRVSDPNPPAPRDPGRRRHPGRRSRGRRGRRPGRGTHGRRRGIGEARARRGDPAAARRPLLRRPVGALAVDRRGQPRRRPSLARAGQRAHHPGRPGRSPARRRHRDRPSSAPAVPVAAPPCPACGCGSAGGAGPAPGGVAPSTRPGAARGQRPGRMRAGVRGPRRRRRARERHAPWVAVDVTVDGFAGSLFSGEVVAVERATGRTARRRCRCAAMTSPIGCARTPGCGCSSTSPSPTSSGSSPARPGSGCDAD